MIQTAAWDATPRLETKEKTFNYPLQIKNKITDKRRLRRKWQTSRSPADKTNYNKAVKELKNTIHTYNSNNLSKKLENLTATKATDYSLWRVTKNMKRPQMQIPPIKTATNQWARSEIEKANAFADHLSNVFTPINTGPRENDRRIEEFLNSPLPVALPIKPFSPLEIYCGIKNHIKTSKSPGYDLITGKILKELPKKGIVFLATLFNNILRTTFIPNQWKVAQIVMVPKPGKPPTEIVSYRPISLLSIISKLFEKLFLSRMDPNITNDKLLPEHQFGFRNSHSTIEQINRVHTEILNTLEEKEYCLAVFLVIQQAFDKVWHEGLLYKIKKKMPQFYLIIKSYLSSRKFQVRYGQEITTLHKIKSGVPQGIVLGPVLYTLYTADLPTGNDVILATYMQTTLQY